MNMPKTSHARKQPADWQMVCAVSRRNNDAAAADRVRRMLASMVARQLTVTNAKNEETSNIRQALAIGTVMEQPYSDQVDATPSDALSCSNNHHIGSTL